MNKLIKMAFAAISCLAFTQCSDFLDTSSPSNIDDEFVSSSPTETLKILSRGYALYRESCFGAYNWNDHFGSDIEYFPENNSSNNINAKLVPEQIPCDYMKDPFNSLYSVIAYTTKAINLISEKTQYKEDIAAGRTTDWTHLKGEAETFRAMCYFDLIKHFGDVPYGYENSYVDDYEITSRFAIYDKLIEAVKAVEPYMYKVGEGGINGQRISRTFANALIGKMALYAGGYQTIRTDMPELYGEVQFEVLRTDAKRKCAYARRADYKNYYMIAQQYLEMAISTNAGTTKLVTTDERTYTDNPFQRHFQFCMDLEQSPETIFELGSVQNRVGGRFYSYDIGRGCNGGNNTAPNKVFAAVRMVPTFYYGGYDNADKRRDVSAVVTGLDGKGNEIVFTFKAGAKTDGGICLNKWDICRQNPYFVGGQGSAGFSAPIMRVADAILMLAEVKAELGANAEAINLVNQIRERAFGNTDHNIAGLSGDALKDAVLMERKLELFGEGHTRYDMVRSAKFSEEALEVRNEMEALAIDLKTKGYYEFGNGNVLPAYIWTKQVEGATLTYDCTDKTDPVQFPGWRGVLDFAKLGLTVNGTTHNTAIKGLFEYIDPNGTIAAQLEQEGYVRTAWGSTLAENIDIYLSNILPGITSKESVPCYYWAIPYETISQSKGKVTNGYGLPQQ